MDLREVPKQEEGESPVEKVWRDSLINLCEQLPSASKGKKLGPLVDFAVTNLPRLRFGHCFNDELLTLGITGVGGLESSIQNHRIYICDSYLMNSYAKKEGFGKIRKDFESKKATFKTADVRSLFGKTIDNFNDDQTEFIIIPLNVPEKNHWITAVIHLHTGFKRISPYILDSYLSLNSLATIFKGDGSTVSKADRSRYPTFEMLISHFSNNLKFIFPSKYDTVDSIRQLKCPQQAKKTNDCALFSLYFMKKIIQCVQDNSKSKILNGEAFKNIDFEKLALTRVTLFRHILTRALDEEQLKKAFNMPVTIHDRSLNELDPGPLQWEMMRIIIGWSGRKTPISSPSTGSDVQAEDSDPDNAKAGTSADTGAVADAVIVPDDDVQVPADAVIVEDVDAVPVPDDFVPVPDDAVPVPDDAVPVPDDAVPVPDDAVPVPDDAVPVPADAVIVEDVDIDTEEVAEIEIVRTRQSDRLAAKRRRMDP